MENIWQAITALSNVIVAAVMVFATIHNKDHDQPKPEGKTKPTT